MKKRVFALVLVVLLFAQGTAMAIGWSSFDYFMSYQSALYVETQFHTIFNDDTGYRRADGLGYAPYNGGDDWFVQIISKSASIWEEPRTDSKKLGSAANGDKLSCVLYQGSPIEENGFFVVKYKNQIGYVNQDYVVLTPLEIVLMESNVPAYIAPDSSSKCVGSLSKHTRYTVIGLYDDYYIINLRGAAAAYISQKTLCYDSGFEKFYLSMPTKKGTIIRNTTLRTGPEEEYPKIADVKKGDKFEFYDMIDVWYMMRYTPKGGEPVFAFVHCEDVDVPIGY